VHLLVTVDPRYGIRHLVKQIEGRSSRALREEFPALRSRLPLGTNSYFVATAGGGATSEVVKRYVESRKNV
jgi:putative transposase